MAQPFLPSIDEPELRKALAAPGTDRVLDWSGGDCAPLSAPALARSVVVLRPAGVPVRGGVVADPIGGLPFRDAALDAAVVRGVLTAGGDPEGALAELGRVVRPGGVLVIQEWELLPGEPGAGLSPEAVGAHVAGEGMAVEAYRSGPVPDPGGAARFATWVLRTPRRPPAPAGDR